jgi:hypothetical protein
MSSNQYPEQCDVARVNLWVKDSKRSEDKFLSGVIEFFQPDGNVVKLNIRAFKNKKRNERSADFYGSVSVADTDVGSEIVLSEKVEVSEVEQPQRSSTPKPSVQKSKLEEKTEIPLF